MDGALPPKRRLSGGREARPAPIPLIQPLVPVGQVERAPVDVRGDDGGATAHAAAAASRSDPRTRPERLSIEGPRLISPRARRLVLHDLRRFFL
jgi:hypothetical protein